MMSKDWLEESKNFILLYYRYTDSTVQYDKKFMPYEIVDKDTKPYIKVTNIKGH